MGIKEANIYLDNQWNTYYPGQTVNGRIEYIFDSPKKVQAITVKFKGEAHTEWTDEKEERDHDGKERRVTEYRNGNEKYFESQYFLLGNNSGGQIEIPPGKQTYTFSCPLPPVLPSSFEGQYGYIRYTVVVTLDRPWKFNQDTKLAFTVINPLDLNLNPSYRQPIHMQMEKTFCCFCCVSAPLSVDVRAPVTGYCPGQTIPVQVDIDNKSNVQLSIVKVFLRKVVTYRVTTPSSATKKSKDIVLTVQEGPVPAHTHKQWTLNMEIPPIPPSNLVNCSIIDLDYDLKVECVTSGAHFNLKDTKYVTIGTVPLVGGPAAPTTPPSPGRPAVLPVAPGQPAQPAQPAQPSAPVMGGDAGGWVAPAAPPQPPPYQSLYPSLESPVYKEGSMGGKRVRDRDESEHVRVVGEHFAPYYPTYATQPPPLPQ